MEMQEDVFSRIEGLLRGSEYAGLAGLLAGTELAQLAAVWTRLPPLGRLAAFKLLDAPRAMELYRRLPFKEKYHLLCGFPLSSIAPILEGLPPARRRLFVSLPRQCYDRMFRQLASERLEIAVPLCNN